MLTDIQSLAHEFPNFDDIDVFADLDASPPMKMLHIDHDRHAVHPRANSHSNARMHRMHYQASDIVATSCYRVPREIIFIQAGELRDCIVSCPWFGTCAIALGSRASSSQDRLDVLPHVNSFSCELLPIGHDTMRAPLGRISKGRRALVIDSMILISFRLFVGNN